MFVSGFSALKYFTFISIYSTLLHGCNVDEIPFVLKLATDGWNYSCKNMSYIFKKNARMVSAIARKRLLRCRLTLLNTLGPRLGRAWAEGGPAWAEFRCPIL